MMDSKDWNEFLMNWQQEVLKCTSYVNNFYVFTKYPQLQNGHKLIEGSEDGVILLEERLEITLPTTYKNFLKAARGWIHITMSSQFLQPEEVNWLRKTDKDWTEIDSDDEYEVPDEDYFVYGPDQDTINIRWEYMKSCLKISTEQDGYMFLLNPEIKSLENEWEAWAFGAKLPGAYRYKNFEDLMRAEFETALEDIKFEL